MSDEQDPKFKYFCYFKELGFPIYVRYPNDGSFGLDMPSFLKTLWFSECEVTQEEEILAELVKNPKARMLDISLCSPSVAMQINSTLESDRFGLESIVPRETFQVYRYKGTGLLVYSFQYHTWKLGVFKDFGMAENEFQARSVLFRYLSWALAPLGIIGFWGTVQEESLQLKKQSESKGEAVFYNYKENVFMTIDGPKKLGFPIQVLKKDETVRRTQTLSAERLVTLLSSRCTFLDIKGHPTSIRQLIQKLSLDSIGLEEEMDRKDSQPDLSL